MPSIQNSSAVTAAAAVDAGAGTTPSTPPEIQASDVQVNVSSPAAAPGEKRRSILGGGGNSTVPPLKVLIASWNVGNTMPPKDSKALHDWVPEGGGDFDVIAIGLQESTYKSEKGDKSSEGLARADSWSTSSSWKPDDVEDDEDDPGSGEDEDSNEKAESEGRGASIPCSGSRKSSIAADETETGGEESAGETTKSIEVIVKRSRTKKSMQKMTKMVRQLSSNLRDTMGDTLDYPFNKQLYVHLGEQYAMVGKVELMEMRLFVYVHERNTVTDVEKMAVPTGLGSVLGNKGGLVFKCVVENTSLCFASCHLAAHQDQKFLDKRNNDCAAILGANFGQKNISFDLQFDHCFWFGDLNYRVDLSYTAPRQRSHEKHCAEVMTLVRAKKWALLNRNDQLRHQVERKKALAGWELPPALFPPTFKRVRHSLDEYLLERVPSYCDRVLYKSLPGLSGNLKLQRFSCVETIATSDHKPVAASFQLARTPPILIDTALALSRPTLVEITELAGKDLLGLDVAGLSDPYVKFYSVPSNALQVDSSGHHPATGTISNTRSPAWRDEQVPKLHVLCGHERDVKRVHLTFMFMDYDATSKDDFMGVASLSLDKFCSNRPRFLPFEMAVARHGKAAGSVTGKIRITLPHQATSSTDDVAQQSIRMVGCHCCLS